MGYLTTLKTTVAKIVYYTILPFFCFSRNDMEVGFENALIIDDSNIWYVAAHLPNITSIVAPGCGMWDSTAKFSERVLQPLRKRLRGQPEIKVILVHFGTNDLQSSNQTNFCVAP